jgi:hypothetical protein
MSSDILARRVFMCYSPFMAQAGAGAGDPRIQVVAGEDGKFLTHFWDEATGTEAVMFYWPEGAGSNPVEERVWEAQRQMTGSDIKDLLAEWSFVPKRGLSDLNRRTVPTAAMNSAFVSSVSLSLLEEADLLDLPKEHELLQIIELIAKGHIAGSKNPALGNRRDLRGRWKELRAVQIYINAIVADQDSKPARKIQEELELENITAARNLIQRARTHGYLSPATSKGDKKNEIKILPAAFSDAEDICNLRNLARSIGSKP